MSAAKQVALADAPITPAGVRLYPILGDAMEPILRSGDYLMVAPCSRYQYETVYLLDDGHGEQPVLAQSCPGALIKVRRPNPCYPEHMITREQFDHSVTAMCVAEVRVKDAGYLSRIVHS